MLTVVPDYYRDFRCIAEKCRHTCCKGWEIQVDGESLKRFLKVDAIAEHISLGEEPHIELLEGECCPFLNERNLCSMIEKYGEDMLCDICRDHPRFRNYWTGMTEIGLGLVCEEAAALILGRKEPMKLCFLSGSEKELQLPEDEQWLWDMRQDMLSEITGASPEDRLREYLIFRHLPDALYDGRLSERLAFIDKAYRELTDAWNKTDGSLAEIAECARCFSYDVEYDDETFERYLE